MMRPTVEVLPRDVYNHELIAQVHPPDWRPPTPAPRYNLVVIGAGTAGLVTAAGGAGLGGRGALVERALPGGGRLHRGGGGGAGRAGGADRAAPAGRRLSQRRLRAVQVRHPLLASDGRG